MDWLGLAGLFGVPVVVAALLYCAARPLFASRATSRKARERALTYSPGEAVWLGIWAAVLAALWANAFL